VRNIFKMLFAYVADIERELVLNLIVGVCGKADRARASYRFQPRGNVDTITIDVALIKKDVPDVKADAELNPAVFQE